MLEKITARTLKGHPSGDALYRRLQNSMDEMPEMKVSFHLYLETIGRWLLEGGWKGPFFTVFLYHVVTKLIDWYQPLLAQASTTIEVNGELQGITGFVARIRSLNGRTILMLANEPGAPLQWNRKMHEIHPVLRHPIQVGVEKWKQVVEYGWVEKDLVLQTILETLGPDVLRQISDWQISIHDPTRIIGQTAIGGIVIDDGQFDKLAEVLAPLGGLVFDREEIKVLLWASYLLSPHTKDGLNV